MDPYTPTPYIHTQLAQPAQPTVAAEEGVVAAGAAETVVVAVGVVWVWEVG